VDGNELFEEVKRIRHELKAFYKDKSQRRISTKDFSGIYHKARFARDLSEPYYITENLSHPTCLSSPLRESFQQAKAYKKLSAVIHVAGQIK
jgi:hypothetical protein